MGAPQPTEKPWRVVVVDDLTRPELREFVTRMTRRLNPGGYYGPRLLSPILGVCVLLVILLREELQARVVAALLVLFALTLILAPFWVPAQQRALYRRMDARRSQRGPDTVLLYERHVELVRPGSLMRFDYELLELEMGRHILAFFGPDVVFSIPRRLLADASGRLAAAELQRLVDSAKAAAPSSPFRGQPN